MTQFSSTGPHIETKDTIEKTMWHVVIALIPATLAAWLLFGTYALYLALATAVSAVLFEWPFVESKKTLKDGSAFLSGLLLGLTLPPGTAWWIPILGGALAMIIGKHLFGGLGNNIFNPALLSRALLLLSFPQTMTAWVEPFDAVSSATPMAPGEAGVDYLTMFLGTTAGSIGGTSVLAIIIGGIYLYLKGYIDAKIPLSFFSGAVITALILNLNPLATILSGGIMFAGVYMITDMVTSPVNRKAKVIYGFGGGSLSVFIGHFTPYPTGIAFAILLMNGASYLLDSLCQGPVFGKTDLAVKRYYKVGVALLTVFLIGGLSFAGTVSDISEYPGELTRNHLQTSFPQAEEFEISQQEDNDLLFTAVSEGEPIGYAVYISRQGGWGEIEKLISFDLEGRLSKPRIIKEREAPTLGARIKTDQFLDQFIGYIPEEAEEVNQELDAISGATLSSLTVSGGVRDSLQFLGNYLDKDTPEEERTSGEFIGTGSGAHGDIEVEVELEAGEIVNVVVLEHADTPDIAEPAFEELEAEVINQQNTDLTPVSGATYSSDGFLEAVENALEANAEVKSDQGSNLESNFSYSPGKHYGSGEGYKGPIEVIVEVEEERIVGIELIYHNDTEARAEPAFEELTEKIIDSQSLDVDTISRATSSSEGFLEAVENALQ